MSGRAPHSRRERSAPVMPAPKPAVRSAFTPEDLDATCRHLHAQGWTAHTEQTGRYTHRLRAERAGVIASITLATRFDPRRDAPGDEPDTGVSVTLLTPHGYACTNAPCETLTLAAHWADHVGRVGEASRSAAMKTQRRAEEARNPWTPRLKLVRKNHALRGAQPRSPESSREHTIQRYRKRYRRTLTDTGLNDLLTASRRAPVLERQAEGRTVRRVSYDGNDIIVILSPDESYLVTTLRPFEYVNLRIARHLLTPDVTGPRPVLNANAAHVSAAFPRAALRA